MQQSFILCKTESQSLSGCDYSSVGVDRPVATCVPSSCQPMLEEEKTEALCSQVASRVASRLYREDGTSDAAMCVVADRLHLCKLELGTLAVVSGKIHGRHSVCTRMSTIGHPAPHDCHAHPCSHDIFPSSGDQGSQEGSALARWAADPANTAWMESKCHWPRGLDPPPLKHLQVLPEGGNMSPFLET